MSDYQRIECRVCGATSLEDLGDGTYRCNYCCAQFKSADVNSYMQSLKDGIKDDVSQVLYEQRTKDIANIRQNLYAALKAEHISSEKILSYCRKLKEYLPEDFQAN